MKSTRKDDKKLCLPQNFLILIFLLSLPKYKKRITKTYSYEIHCFKFGFVGSSSNA